MAAGEQSSISLHHGGRNSSENLEKLYLQLEYHAVPSAASPLVGSIPAYVAGTSVQLLFIHTAFRFIPSTDGRIRKVDKSDDSVDVSVLSQTYTAKYRSIPLSVDYFFYSWYEIHGSRN